MKEIHVQSISTESKIKIALYLSVLPIVNLDTEWEKKKTFTYNSLCVHVRD